MNQMNTSTIEARRSPGKRLGIFALGLAVACAGMFGLASSKAEAAPTQAGFSMQFNDGYLNLGAAFVGQKILPAPAKLGEDTALPNWWNIVDSLVSLNAGFPGAAATQNVCTDPDSAGGAPNANVFYPCQNNPGYGEVRGQNTASSNWNPFAGTITLDSVSNPQTLPIPFPWSEPLNTDFRFPIMVVPSPLDGDPIPITLAATDGVTGSYDGTTGALTLTPDTPNALEARVLVGLGIPDEIEGNPTGGPQPFTYCATPLPSLTLSTGAGSGGAAFTSGSPFTTGLGLEGAGAVQGSYTIEANSTPTTQLGLSLVGQAAAAAALEQCATVDLVTKGSGGIWFGNRTDAPVCEEGQLGVYPDCVDQEARISKIAIAGANKVKAGKKVKLTVRVTNSGTADKSVKLRLWSSSGIAKVTKTVTVNAPADGVGTKKVTVTAKKKKKGKVTISATNGERTGQKKVTVRR
jgi:hypothetical protein